MIHEGRNGNSMEAIQMVESFHLGSFNQDRMEIDSTDDFSVCSGSDNEDQDMMHFGCNPSHLEQTPEDSEYCESLLRQALIRCGSSITRRGLKDFPSTVFHKHSKNGTQISETKARSTIGQCTTFITTTTTHKIVSRNNPLPSLARLYSQKLDNGQTDINCEVPHMMCTFEELLSPGADRLPVHLKLSFTFYSFTDLSTFCEVLINVEDEEGLLELPNDDQSFQKEDVEEDDCGIDLTEFASKLTLADKTD